MSTATLNVMKYEHCALLCAVLETLEETFEFKIYLKNIQTEFLENLGKKKIQICNFMISFLKPLNSSVK